MHWRTRLSQPEAEEQRKRSHEFTALVSPTHRGSTVVFPSMNDVREGWLEHGDGYSYGIYGTPTALELGRRIADLEGARHTFVVPSGQAAISLIYLSFCSGGSHVLLPDTAYGPSKEVASGLLKRLGVTVELYPATIGGGIAALLKPHTALVWCESPGSITMEVQDVPAIAAAAHAQGVPVALDNTYAAGVLFDAFAHGVDVSMQALTKYAGGHSDFLLGSVSVAAESHFLRVGDTFRALGMHASPDDCSLALRGLGTLGVRLQAMERAALEIARWLAAQPEVATVLHPALPGCAGHDLWKRDFSGSASIFSILLQESFSTGQANAFADALRLFRIGWSWGGVTSLVMVYPSVSRLAAQRTPVIRFHIGLEDTQDLIEDLERALQVLRS